MGIPLIPPALAGAYGLALGNIAGRHFWRNWMDPRGHNQLENYNHVRGRASRNSAPSRGDITTSTSTSTAQTMKRGRSYTTTKRRRGKGRRNIRRRIRKISNMWPRFRLVQFRVVSLLNQSVTSAQTTTTVHNLRANAIDDPHGGLSQNLPLGLDQWAGMYKKYVVVKSTHYAKIHNVTSTGSVVFGITLRRPNESDNLSSPEYYQELPMTRSKILSPDMDHAAVGITYRAKPYWGVRKFMDHDDLHATLSTTPTAPSKDARVQVWHADTATGENYTIEGYITSVYTCLLFDPVTPSRSAI